MKHYTLAPFVIGTMRLGSWGANMDTKAIQEFIEGCLDLGFVDFDHADIYGGYTTEQEFGAVLKNNSSLREKLKLTTKCGIKILSENRPNHKIKSYDLSKKHIIDSVENSLRYLNTDYLDTLLLHRPDYLLNAEEVAEVFTKLKADGKVKHFGVSNFSASQFDLLHSFFPLCTNQVEISLLHREAFENGVLDQLQKLKITPTAWSPLGGGSLFKDSDSEIGIMLQHLADTHNAQKDQILFAWLRKHPAGIVPVLGTSKLSRIKDAKKSLDIQLTHEEWYMLWKAAIGKDVD